MFLQLDCLHIVCLSSSNKFELQLTLIIKNLLNVRSSKDSDCFERTSFENVHRVSHPLLCSRLATDPLLDGGRLCHRITGLFLVSKSFFHNYDSLLIKRFDHKSCFLCTHKIGVLQSNESNEII